MKNPIWNEQIVLPEISCPFPSQISTHYETVKAHTLDWALRLGLTPYQTALQYYHTADYPGLACRTYPRAGLEELFLASDWLFLIFVFDDPFDEGAFDNKPQEMLAFHEHLLAVMHDSPLTTPRGPVAEAFSDIFRRAKSFASPTWLKRFQQHHAENFAAIRWQVANRERQHMPDLQAYLSNRVHAAGVLPPFDLIEIVQHREIPPEIYARQSSQALLQAGNNLIAWTNDLHSVKKDVACGDVNSLVMAIQREQNGSLQQAVDQLHAMIETETKRFLDMLWAPSADADQYVAPLWIGIANWIRGHLDWYRGNKRYTEEATRDNSHLVDILAESAQRH
jgi:5-epi-alpha-selinene synthase